MHGDDGEMTNPARSARGIFRATGKTAKPVTVVSGSDLAGDFETAEGLPRETHDFYPTPIEPIRAFLAHEGPRLRALGGHCWEPAAGDGALVRELEAYGLTVEKSDLVDRGCGATIGDFLAIDWPLAPLHITNPPYNLINWRDGQGRWLTHARRVHRAPYVALLLNWAWAGAAGLNAILTEDPPARIYLMQWKIDFTGQGAPPMLNGWFIWDGETPRGETRFLTMQRNDDWRQSCFFD